MCALAVERETCAARARSVAGSERPPSIAVSILPRAGWPIAAATLAMSASPSMPELSRADGSGSHEPSRP